MRTRFLVPAASLLALLAADPGSAQPPRPEGARVPIAVPGAPSPPGAARAKARATGAPVPATLEALLASTPADSLAAPLRRFEAEHGRTRAGAEAAFTLGQFHFARGEYRQAGDAFARAAARFPPERKPEARYWQGLSSLGEGEPVQARAALEEVAGTRGDRRAEARYAIAEAWDKSGRPERAVEVLRELLADAPGDMAAPALERLSALSLRLGDTESAKRAGEELERSHPSSIEAMRRPETPAVVAPVASPGKSEKGRIGVQIGAFSDEALARGLVQRARQSGFARAASVRQGTGGTALHLVRIGWYASEEDARRAGELASRELGVAYRLVRQP